MGAPDSRPIGVFDSGIGGLTVLRALRAQMPNENFVYLGDTARLPYGSKSEQTIRRYSEQNMDFLLSYDVKAIVIACNTASTQVQEPEWQGIPVYNVIQPGVKKALAVTSRNRIGLIATRATVRSGMYEESIRRARPEVQIWSQVCPLLVPLAEEGLDGDPLSNLIVFRYLLPLMQQQIDTLILGCTHYPLLEGSLLRVTRDDVQLVDSGASVADVVSTDIANGRLKKGGHSGQVQLLLTDDSESFYGLAQKILGPDFQAPQRVETGLEKK